MQTTIDWLEDNLIGNPHSEEDFKHNINIWGQAKQMEKEQIIEFHNWMIKNDIPENAEKYFHYSDNDMLNEYLKDKL